jgi:hypothetical protein
MHNTAFCLVTISFGQNVYFTHCNWPNLSIEIFAKPNFILRKSGYELLRKQENLWENTRPDEMGIKHSNPCSSSGHQGTRLTVSSSVNDVIRASTTFVTHF